MIENQSENRTQERPVFGQESITDRLFKPVDIAFLVYFRILFGLIMIWQMWMYLSTNQLELKFVTPTFHFKYYGFEWVEPWPGVGMQVHFFVLALLALFITLGLFYRASAFLFFLGFTYMFLIDKTYYQNHYYLVCMISFWMIFLPAHRGFSLDASRNAKLRSEAAPAWNLWLLRFLIGLPYFFGGVAKLNPDWLRGEPVRSLLYSRALKGIPESLLGEPLVWFLSYGGMLFDLMIVPLLLWRPTRPFVFLAALGFHLMNASMFHIGIFPWFMIGATLLFFPPAWPRFARWRSGATLPQLSDAPSGIQLTKRQTATAGVLYAFVTIQMLLPLRHFLYEGNPSWTGEGDLFAWRMKLDDISGSALYLIKDRKSGAVTSLEPRQILTNPYQSRGMVRHPEMIREFSVHLKELAALRGKDVEVSVTTQISLNGRRPQPSINPNLDLAQIPRTLFGPRAWIVPLREPLPDAATTAAKWKRFNQFQEEKLNDMNRQAKGEQADQVIYLDEFGQPEPSPFAREETDKNQDAPPEQEFNSTSR